MFGAIELVVFIVSLPFIWFHFLVIFNAIIMILIMTIFHNIYWQIINYYWLYNLPGTIDECDNLPDQIPPDYNNSSTNPDINYNMPI